MVLVYPLIHLEHFVEEYPSWHWLEPAHADGLKQGTLSGFFEAVLNIHSPGGAIGIVVLIGQIVEEGQSSQ